jgi:lysophospholipase L1-like esterase
MEKIVCGGNYTTNLIKDNINELIDENVLVKGDVTTLQSDVVALGGDSTSLQTDVTTLQTESTSLRTDVDGLIDIVGTRQKNAENLGKAWIKLSLGGAVSLAFIGDSMTAGYDINSADSIPPDNGDHVNHATVTYPIAVKNVLSKITGANHTFINRGYSGDTAKTGYDRYPTQISGDVAHIMFGINDSSFANGATYPQYAEYMELLIQRYVGWGFGVVLHTPTAQTFNAENKPARKWSASIRKIAEMYGCPVFDSAVCMQYAAFEGVYSDVTHFNSHGYQKYGEQVAAFIAAGGWVLPAKKISGNTTLSIGGEEGVGFFSPNTSLISSENGSFLRNANAGGPIGSDTASITWSFYQDSDAMIVSCNGILEGLQVNFDEPLGEMYVGDNRGLLSVNAHTLRSEQSKRITQTRPFVFSAGRDGVTRGRLVKAGLLVGRGWKNVTFSYPTGLTGNKYVASLILQNVDSNYGEPEVFGNGLISSARMDCSVFQYPYPAPYNASSTPTAEALPSDVYINMPAGAYPSSSDLFSDYFDYIPIEIDIYGSLTGQFTKVILNREGSSNAFSINVVSSGAAGTDLVPTSATIAHKVYDKTIEDVSDSFVDALPSVSLDNLYIKLSFGTTPSAYYKMVVKSVGKLSNITA